MRRALCLPICVWAAALLVAPAQAQDNEPITFRVTSREGGFDRFARNARWSQGDLKRAADEVARRLADSRRLRSLNFTAQEPEVWVTIGDCWRDETSRSRNKDGTESVGSRYKVVGSVDFDRRHVPIDAEVIRVHNTKDSRDDSFHFEEAAHLFADRAFDGILSFLDALRPNRPQPGFDFKAKHKFLLKGNGLEVTAVAPLSPADRAGLAVGDRIRMIEGEKGTDDMYVLARELWLRPAGSRVALEVERGKKRHTFEIVLLPPSRWSEKSPVPASRRPPASTATRKSKRP
jgi:hypothetical protein